MINKIIIKLFGIKGLKIYQLLLSNFYINKFNKYKNTKKIFYCLTPEHGNMGDQAIAYATLNYLEKNFNDYYLIEVRKNEIYKYYKAIKKSISENDLIMIHGGGNMGNLYLEEENARRFIISKFKNNPIISMTQTISFSDDKEGKRELDKTKDIYKANKNFIIIAREEKSYEIMKNEFNNSIILTPDIVFSLEDFNYFCKDVPRTKIMTCLRNDKESIWKDKKDIFIESLKSNFKYVFEHDTVVNYEISKLRRENELFKIWNEFLESKVVITDRLHGMVFAAITKTPCIVLKSLDHKVNESYKWLSNLNYIKYVDNLDYLELEPLINELMNLEKIDESNFNIMYFNNLRNKIMEFYSN